MFKLTDTLGKLKSLANKDNNMGPQETGGSESSVKIVRNWYEEKYDKVVVHRNILFVLLFVSLIISITTIIAIAIVVNSKQYDPFVIQIDDSTGMATIVNPITSTVLEGNEALAKYFIKKYVIARETYNPVDFDTSARKTVRLLSTNSVFMNFIGYIRNKEIDPTIFYGQKNTTFLTVKSWSKLDAKKYMLRFSVNENEGDKKTFNKLAVIDFDYVPMELTDAERDINPIGFQVKGYRVDDDNS